MVSDVKRTNIGRLWSLSIAVAFCAIAMAPLLAQSPKPRARDLGVAPGVFPPGPLNAITDVEGVRVGHTTVIEG